MNAASPTQCSAAGAVGRLTAAPLRRMRIGSTGRWPVGFGGPPKPPSQLTAPPMNPQNTQTTQRNPNNSLLCALGASAIPMYSPSVETDPVDRPPAVLLALQTARFTQANKGNQSLG